MSIGSIASVSSSPGFQALNPPAPPPAAEAALNRTGGHHNHHHNATETAPTTSTVSTTQATLGPTAGNGASGNTPPGLNLTV